MIVEYLMDLTAELTGRGMLDRLSEKIGNPKANLWFGWYLVDVIRMRMMESVVRDHRLKVSDGMLRFMARKLSCWDNGGQIVIGFHDIEKWFSDKLKLMKGKDDDYGLILAGSVKFVKDRLSEYVTHFEGMVSSGKLKINIE